MGLLKSLFGSGKREEAKVSVNVKMQNNEKGGISTSINVSTKIQNLILLTMAERFKINEKNYPDYLRSNFGIGFPNEKYKALFAEGFIRPASAAESLPHLRVTELKAIATEYKLKTSGKKEELCQRLIESIPPENLESNISERYWVITEEGHIELAKNPYIGFYLDKHKYSLESIGLDITTFSKLFSEKNDRSIRDVIWGEFNRKTTEFYKKAITKSEFREYCELLRTMALFLEEEGRYSDALATYIRYLYYGVNFEAALKAIQYYSVTKDLHSAAEILYTDVEMMPYTANEIMNLSNGCEYDSTQLRTFMLDAFSREQDSGMFSPTELTELIMLGLNGDAEGQMKICSNAMRVATKKIPKKK